MSDLAIRIENLSKSYTIAHNAGARATNLREAMIQRLRKPFARSETETFWALKDIDLEIKRGEVVGVIGRNGAGKSTLLKILSRITEPTSGRVELFGRVGSLLEVGTGFHPELTGRENIYLNGAILGMRKSEINRQFDAIVDFAGVEKFLDTPVKRYSSGMYVRLAFAVAAHLNPEILIVDEVLAVGDAEFQKKCMGKMKNVAINGRTVLFVSHNLGAVADLCSRAVYLSQGSLNLDDTPETAVKRYFRDTSNIRPEAFGNASKLNGSHAKPGYFSGIDVVDENGESRRDFSIRESLALKIHFRTTQSISNLDLSMRLVRSDGLPLFTSLQSENSPDAVNSIRLSESIYELRIPAMFLLPGEYLVNLAAHPPLGQVIDSVESAICFAIHDTGSVYEKYGNYSTLGTVFSGLRWRLSESQAASNEGAFLNPGKLPYV